MIIRPLAIESREGEGRRGNENHLVVVDFADARMR